MTINDVFNYKDGSIFENILNGSTYQLVYGNLKGYRKTNGSKYEHRFDIEIHKDIINGNYRLIRDGY